MKQILKHSSLIFLFLFSTLLMAQENQPKESYTFSLEEAIEFGLDNNYDSQIAEKDIEKALKQKWEIISQGLPQITGGVDYQNYLKQPVTLIPAEIAGGEPGTFMPVRFGTKQSMNATATWNQLIFDGSYIVGVQSAKTLLEISENIKIKTDQEVEKAIISAYSNVLLAEESVKILNRNVSNIQKNYDDTKKIFENGLAEEEDVERLEITLLTLKNNLNRSVRMRDVAYEMLNITLGLPIETTVTLSENLEDLTMKNYDLALLEKTIPIEDNIDYIIAEDQKESAEIQVKFEKAKALPSLSAFVNYGYQGFNEEFNFLDSDQDYFAQSILGVSLNIPIFDGFRTTNRVEETLHNYYNIRAQEEERRQQIALEVEQSYLRVVETQERIIATEAATRAAKENLDLAQGRYQVGVGSIIEVTDAETLYTDAQTNYVRTLYDYKIADAQLARAMGDHRVGVLKPGSIR